MGAVDGQDQPELAQIQGVGGLEARFQDRLLDGNGIWEITQGLQKSLDLVAIDETIAILIALLHHQVDLGDLLLADSAHAHEVLSLVDSTAAIDVHLVGDLVHALGAHGIAEPAEDARQLLGVELTGIVPVESVVHTHEVGVFLVGKALTDPQDVEHLLKFRQLDDSTAVFIHLRDDLREDVRHGLDAEALQQVRELVDLHRARVIHVAAQEGELVGLALANFEGRGELDEVLQAQGSIFRDGGVDLVDPLLLGGEAHEQQGRLELVSVDLTVVHKLLEDIAPNRRPVLDFRWLRRERCLRGLLRGLLLVVPRTHRGLARRWSGLLTCLWCLALLRAFRWCCGWLGQGGGANLCGRRCRRGVAADAAQLALQVSKHRGGNRSFGFGRGRR
mmetsp:Transcript_119662/g.381894  ORF Transcript_119662/g.381894 Transcript_119662/m.381894 type:complete len:390 (+) Transcript_119662:1129-2298(+)